MESRFFGRERVNYGVDLHNGLHRKIDPLLRVVKHFSNAVELVLMDEIPEEKIFRELYSYLSYVFRFALMVFPYMLQLLAGDKRKVVFADNLDGVSHNTPHSFGIFNIIDLELAVGMQRVGEFRFSPIGNIKAVLIR
jgi:hypothetical protein